MLNVKNDFLARSEEIRVYIAFACDVVDGVRSVDPPLLADEFEQLKKTVKANAFLLLYNLMESTIANAVEAIFDELKMQAVRFDDCRTELQCLILKNLRKHNVDKIHPKLADISLHVVTETFQKKRIFSGNVDARKVRDTADEFGFAPPANGHKLVKVKNARNDLAHGDKSFAEVGRDSTTTELSDLRVHVTNYLNDMLTIIDVYLTRKQYLAAAAGAAPASPPATTTVSQ